MTAREMFRRGDRVEMTQDAPKFGVSKRTGLLAARTGVVVGFGREPHLVRVKRDGVKEAAAWHVTFWRVVERSDDTRAD